MRKLAAVASLAALSACVTAAQAPTARPIPKERAGECAAHCETLGMRLSAIVVIMSSVGCVCEPEGAKGTGATSAAAAAASGAAIAAAAKEARDKRATETLGSPEAGNPDVGVDR